MVDEKEKLQSSIKVCFRHLGKKLVEYLLFAPTTTQLISLLELTFPGNEIVSFQLFFHFPVKPLFPITRDRGNFSRKIPSCFDISKLAIDITIYFENS